MLVTFKDLKYERDHAAIIHLRYVQFNLEQGIHLRFALIQSSSMPLRRKTLNIFTT